jgi:hypothetical protein
VTLTVVVGVLAALPIDCLPDRVSAWRAAEPNPGSRYGANNLPGIVSGPPGDSAPTQGSTTVASLGHQGRVVIGFDDIEIEDRPGPDFIVFENPFFVGAVPTGPTAPFSVFAEAGFVEVSLDGISWQSFPYDAAALNESRGKNIDQAMHLRLRGLAGITPTFTGNWTVPDDPEAWDASGQGGVSGAGGDAFDLATIGWSRARFVRISDADSRNGPAGSAEGFDLDAVVVLHGRPLMPSSVDQDGDRLPDAAETAIYGSDPLDSDTDGDGTDDGSEVASCRDPSSFDTSPWWIKEPRIWIKSGSCSDLRWTFLGSGASYDLLRGRVRELRTLANSIDLGVTQCVVNDTVAVRFACDAALPAPGDAFFYTVRRAGNAHYGWSALYLERHSGAACP